MLEDEMVGLHHRLDGHEFKYALGVGDGQGSMVGCSPWGQGGGSLLLFLIQFSSVQLLSCVRLFATPWTAASQACLSITNSLSYSNSCPLSR